MLINVYKYCSIIYLWIIFSIQLVMHIFFMIFSLLEKFNLVTEII